MRSWVKGIAIAAIITGATLAYNFYPNERNILNGKYYNIVQSQIDKEFEIDINTRDYLHSTGEIKVNRLIYKGNETEIALEKVINHKDRIDIFINSKINWHFKSGECLSINKINNEQGFRTFTVGDISTSISDDKGNKLDAQFGTGPGELVCFTFEKEVFEKTSRIIIKLKGYHKTDYYLSFLN